MTNYPFSTEADPAAYLLKAEHAEEYGDGRMARAWRWMAERAKWPQVGAGWWPDDYEHHPACHRVSVTGENHFIYWCSRESDCEAALADLLDKGEL